MTEITQEEKQGLIVSIHNVSEHFLDIIDLIERAAAYKTRQHIKLTNQEIKEMKQNSLNAFIVLIRNVLCLEKFIEKKDLKEESLRFIQVIIDEFKRLKKG